jgi:Beta-galactosidase trimerisation domain
VNRQNETSRRRFLRSAFGATALGISWLEGRPSSAGLAAERDGKEASVVARVHLADEIFEAEGTLRGEVFFHQPPEGTVSMAWVDGVGRVVKQLSLSGPKSKGLSETFSFSLADGLTYRNSIQVFVNQVPQTEGARFLLAPPARVWDDFHTLMWAHYPDGNYDLLAKAGVDSTIAYRDNDFSAILDNNFHFYVEQMAWEIFAVYHKRQTLWHGWQDDYQAHRENWELLVRQPCLNDPKTDEYLRERLTRMVRMHKAFKPLFYNIADELGQGDQIQPTDFCHSTYCTVNFAEYLRSIYGTAGNVGSEWAGIEIARWDDEAMKSGLPLEHGDLMIARTTTDRAFDSIAVAGLAAKYGSLERLNKEWGTAFPEPRGGGTSREDWESVTAMAGEARGIPVIDEHSLEAKLGPLDVANARWGKRGGWRTSHQPTKFQSWGQVAAFVKRFYSEVAEINSTAGWNVASWCDFRNFMDATFAAAVQRARAMCRAEDPDALCATEGGQAPAAFGWYNYQRVAESVDVIEPYNTANNVELLRSLNSKVAILGTHAYSFTPGKPLNDLDRVEQKRKVREIWWQLFHGYRGAIIWDNMETNIRFVDKNHQLTPAAEAFSEVFHEVRSGIGRLILNSHRTHDGIAIHYSHASVQIHWLLENLVHARDWVLNKYDVRLHFNGIRNSWTKLIEDLSLQYDFVSRDQIEAGKLSTGEFRVFIMPKSVAVSEREAQQIQEFVEAGGLLLTDFGAATMNEHGRDLGAGQLDDVFGIRRIANQDAAASNGAMGNAGAMPPKERRFNPSAAAEPAIALTTGKAQGPGAKVPTVITNDFGRGRAVFLNLDVADYAVERLRPGSWTELPDLLQGILSGAKLEPRVRVIGADGKRVPGVEVVVYQNGDCEHTAVFRNPQFDSEGFGDYEDYKRGDSGEEVDNSYLEKPVEVTLQWPSAMATVDVRHSADLGTVQTYKTTLDPWWPTIVTRSPQAIPKISIAAPESLTAGRHLDVKLGSGGNPPAGALRAVRVEVAGPDGHTYDLYSRNCIMRGSSHVETIPLALNDPRGKWNLRARDWVTGQTVEAAFSLV